MTPAKTLARHKVSIPHISAKIGWASSWMSRYEVVDWLDISMLGMVVAVVAWGHAQDAI